ncbi:MAG TPA: protein phosphatase 2C domain-containing protein [Polyangiaceae bacterium]|nr:protein phosphatase 2C domain-containing protein [Polyangiaceae bacterium]
MPSALPRFDFRVDFAGATDVGKVRKNNEDTLAIAPDLALFGVADGMGGHAAGEVAAKIAVDTVVASVREKEARRVIDRFPKDPSLDARHGIFALLRKAFQRANEGVRAEAEKRNEPSGMGTTLDFALLVRDRAFVAHTGDSRVYLARSSTVIQLTHDHALFESMLAAGTVRRTPGRVDARRRRNPLVNAIGIAPTTSVDTCFVEVTRGDRLLLCSDGVHGEIESESILAQLLRTGSAEDAANALIAYALRRGGRDNATALVIDICERFIARSSPDGAPTSGPVSSDILVARHSALLEDLSVPSVLAALAAAVEVEIPKDERVPRLVANDWVCYIVVSGQVMMPDGRVLGPSGLVFVESLMGIAREGDLPVVVETARLMRLRADDFAEVCAQDLELSNALHIRIARHLARQR